MCILFYFIVFFVETFCRALFHTMKVHSDCSCQKKERKNKKRNPIKYHQSSSYDLLHFLYGCFRNKQKYFFYLLKNFPFFTAFKLFCILYPSSMVFKPAMIPWHSILLRFQWLSVIKGLNFCVFHMQILSISFTRLHSAQMKRTILQLF